MNEEEKWDIIKRLDLLRKALSVAKEGLEVLKDKEPIAQKTLEEIDKIYKEILES